ncbi:MAG TPA: peptidoglycan-binding domain-containing protein [bacterium]|nr:peptidoglycan-binding domain-containing protein [bacterium]
MQLPAGKTLKKGDSGQAVSTLQYLLLNSGFDVGPGGDSGVFDDGTDAAVRYFQNVSRLQGIDGVVGPKTGAALQEYHDTLLKARQAAKGQGVDNWMLDAFLTAIGTIPARDWPAFLAFWQQDLRQKFPQHAGEVQTLMACLTGIKEPNNVAVLNCLLQRPTDWQGIVSTFLESRRDVGKWSTAKQAQTQQAKV